MHLSSEAQRAAHVALVRAALPAGWRGHDVIAHPAERAQAYRSRARVHVRASGGRAIVGLHGAASHEPVEVDACLVLAPEVEAARARLAALFDGAHGYGEVQIAIGRGAQGALPVLEIRWSGVLAAACFARLEDGVRVGAWAGARVTCGEVSRPAVIGDPAPCMVGADGEPLLLSPGGFAQAADGPNLLMGRRLAEEIATCSSGKARGGRLVELYAGAGNLTVVLARKTPGMIAVESSRHACEAARANLFRRGLDARVVEADAERYVWSPPTDIVVLDPPRTGARAVVERLAASRVRHVVYVSCDPATLGRDLAVLAGSYALRSIETFEMFPQTSHVETLVRLERVALPKPPRRAE
jgi:23S rRNA (uracil1939-C5)-methyltransferase